MLVMLGAAAIALTLVAHLVFLTVYPPVFIDESWSANATWNWLRTGVNFDAMHAGTLDQFGYEWMTRYFLGQLPWYVAFGALGLGLFQARLVSWLFGVALALLTVIVGRRLFGTLAGVLAGLLLSLSMPFAQASHFARQDIMLAVVMLLAFGVAWFALEKERAWAHLLAGLLVSVSLDIHQNAIQFALALAALYLVHYGKNVYRKRGTWLAGVGGALGVAAFVVFRILPSPETYFKLWGVYLGSEHELPLLNLGGLLNSAIGELGRYRFYDNGLDFALIGASIVYLAVRRTSSDQRLLAFAGAAGLGSVLLVGNKSPLYGVLLYPYLMLMVASTFVCLISTAQRLSRQQIFLGALLALFLGNSAVHLARPIYLHRSYDYYAITEWIETVIPPGARVMGLPTWWLGLADHDYRSSLNLTFYQHFNGYSLSEALEAVRPDIIIFDGALAGLLVGEGETLAGGQELYQLPREAFLAFLEQRGDKLLDFTDPWHGHFEIYAIRWES